MLAAWLSASAAWLASLLPGFRGNGCFYEQNYADFADRLLLLYAVIDEYRQ
jgi:hypothetical protein